MIEVRFHGRGGQGAVTSAELMAQAAIGEGKYAQAFPSFGPERRGAPVTSFLRVSEVPIRLREKVSKPNVVVILDPTVMNVTKVNDGLQDDGLLIINTSRPIADIRKQYGFTQKIAVVDAYKIAEETLGVPITNTVMMGALIKATQMVRPESVKEPLSERFGSILAPKNQKALEQAFAAANIES